MRSRKLGQVGLAVAIVALLAAAVGGLIADGPGPQDRAYELEQRLRCPVCKSVSIAESPSETAQAMRTAVAQQVAAGRTDRQIIDYFRARYGNWVLLDPPASGSTLPLWLLPAAAALVGGTTLIVLRRRHERPSASLSADLTAEQRDQALRDIRDLERQVAEQEIPEDVADRLRRHYETVAAQAIDAPGTGADLGDAGTRRRSRARLAAYVAGAAVAIFAVAVLLPQYLANRPAGGAVTGNEVLAPAPNTAEVPPASPDLSTVSDTELETMVAANPTAVGMRLALAGRYVAQEKYDQATDHYGVALQQDPGNPKVLGGAGWLLFKLGKVEDALRFVNQALAVAPEPDALWYKANILLDGYQDARAALEVLRPLAGRNDVSHGLRTQVNQLIIRAEQAGGQ